MGCNKRPTEASKWSPYNNSLGMKFVPVPITDGPTNGKKVLFGVWDTRLQDYRVYAQANPGVDQSFLDPGFKQGEDHPVVSVSWNDAKAFCSWLTRKERREGKIGANDEYRLPTDYEWSCAVGIGDQEDANATPGSKGMKIAGVYPWGKQWPPPRGVGNYDASLKVDDYEFTSPVGSFTANQYGLFDMGGNVWQWCEDLCYTGSDIRELRGASWYGSVYPVFLLSSFRLYDPPVRRSVNCGFRCVLVAGSPR